MEITFIGHSGFLIEWETCYWLFDYYKGNIPEMDPGKKIFVFASHVHSDHFNPEIFRLLDRYPDMTYVLSFDIRLSAGYSKEAGIPTNVADKIIFVKPSSEYRLPCDNGDGIRLETLRSTDSGVAFLLHYRGKTIYHAGDLNLWVWKKETTQYNNNMTTMFEKEMKVLKNVLIDVAFAPLDSRQEEDYYKGLDRLLNTAKVRYVFPMHFWDNPSIIRQFKQEHGMNYSDTQIMDIHESGQKWHIGI